ncbi:MAG: PIN domain-containing protein [Oscillospiraceae bacterium]|nr:PIN domain-containing protein [Oscillospiraceae bacterium]
MKDKVFLDTNVFVYTQSSVEPKKRTISLNAIEQYDCVVSTQIFSEICNVMIKKLQMHIDEVKQIIAAVNDKCSVAVVTYDTVQLALDLKERYGYSYYDSLVLATALESGCQKIFTEDMRNGQIIENTLKIVNIFQEVQSG